MFKNVKLGFQEVTGKECSSPIVSFSKVLDSGDNSTPKATEAPKSDDPWDLELFNESKQSSKVESHEPRAGVLITNQGIHLVQAPNSKKPRPKIQRSLSQPQFPPGRFRSFNLLSFPRKINLQHSNQNLQSAGHESTFYLYSVMWCCLVMLFWKNIILLPLLPLPILYYLIKHTGTYLGLWSYLIDKFVSMFDQASYFCMERHDALVPVPIRGLYKFMHKINSTVKSSIKGSIDTVASCVVIFGLIVFLVCASIFTALQVSKKSLSFFWYHRKR